MIDETLLHYRITEKIGAGGMGEVYRARDTKLNRDVAIKVLPEDVAGDEARLARFRREAQVLASLNHPNIAAIYGLEETDGVAALALELVEGEDLAERLKRGAIPYEEAIAIAHELAAGLEAAHEKGIVHRDLKPGNIKLGADGGVKILDFGLAKAYEAEAAAGGDSALSQSPTISRQMTQAGMILGTAAYMSPEQAKGKPVDKRTDIWAFGVVLYEMLTGKGFFAGEDLTETLASVVKDQPDVSVVPREVRRLLAKCLERDPKRRLRDIGDAWDLLDDTIESVTTMPTRLPWIVAAAATLVAVATVVFDSPSTEEPAVPIRFHVDWPIAETASLALGAFFQLSPDGGSLAIVEGNQLWVRSLDAFDARALENTEGATYPFWSPNGAWVGFFADGQLKKISLGTGQTQLLCDAPEVRGATWSPNGTILFAPKEGDEGILGVADRGGEPEPVTTLARLSDSDGDHRYPQFLPDGEHFLYLHLSGAPETAGVYVGSLTGETTVRILEGSDRALFTRPTASSEEGHLIFRRGDNLMAQAFDVGRLETVGAMFPVADRVGNAGNTGYGAISTADTGSLAYWGGEGATAELVWLDRAGKRVATALPAARVRTFSLSPDERKVATAIRTQRTIDGDIWLQDLPDGAPSRFTFGPSPGWMTPIWSPDGEEIVFKTYDKAGLREYQIRRKRFDMSGDEAVLFRSERVFEMWDWSPDGALLLVSVGSAADADLAVITLDGEATSSLFSSEHDAQWYGQFSPDGRWIAYVSNDEVFVQPYPTTGALWQVSNEGGSQPRWRADGKELFYRTPEGRLMATSVTTNARSAGFEHGTPQPLFDAVPAPHLYEFTYQPARDGQSFLVAMPLTGTKTPITLLLNWRSSVTN